ncbi:MAG: hypothetical protein ACOC0R_03300, partial [Mariniphaga sp.]
MLNLYKYLLPLLLFPAACESVYTPELDAVDDVLVVDARLVYGQQKNEIILQTSNGFNDNNSFNPVIKARVVLTDDSGEEYLTTQNEPGIYTLHQQLDSLRQYKLLIYAEGEIFESEFEAVPPLSETDTIYSDHAELWIQPGGENSTDEFIKHAGQQLYVDIDNSNTEEYYRFTARKIHQFYFPFDTVLFGVQMQEIKYGWRSYYAQESYNLAGPADYSSETDISRHPVE